MTDAWTPQPGHEDAKTLVAQYPTPHALRQALRALGPGMFSEDIRALPWNPHVTRTTIGDVLVSVCFGPRDVATLHAVLTWYARDREIWTAPDGSQTIRIR
jgi:hypothetical protein